MKNELVNFIKKIVKKPNQNEINEILEIFTPKNFKKGDLFKEAYDNSDKIGFILSGAFRNFIIKENGDEITTEIIEPNSIITDIISMRLGKNPGIQIECIEDATVLETPEVKMRKLLECNLTFNFLIREHLAHRAAELSQRHLMFLTSSSENRLDQLKSNQPELFNKYPLKYIATIIGITPTQLSRLRRKNKYNQQMLRISLSS